MMDIRFIDLNRIINIRSINIIFKYNIVLWYYIYNEVSTSNHDLKLNLYAIIWYYKVELM